MMGIILEYKYLIVPFATWFFIQLFKLVYDLVTTKKFNFKRILGAGGMPSSHSAVVVSLQIVLLLPVASFDILRSDPPNGGGSAVPRITGVAG